MGQLGGPFLSPSNVTDTGDRIGVLGIGGKYSMSTLPLNNRKQLSSLRSHLIGFAETHAECVAICRALSENGINDSRIRLLCGDSGIHLLIRMMGRSSWGDVADDVLRQGLIELDAGHWVLIIDAIDRQQAQTATEIASPIGGYGFTHIGM